MNKFLERMASGAVLVSDGATGTNLQQVGLVAGQHAEDWVFDHPDRIFDLEKAFVDAGADIILTCTFGGTSVRMQGAKHAERVAELNLQAASLARDAASSRDGVLVAGSMGPLGKLLKPFGQISQDEARAAYAQQAKALSDAPVDLLVIETQFSLEEAQAALEGAQATTDLPVVVSFSYDQGTRTMMGVKPADVAARFGALGATLIGVNCGTTLANAETVLQEYAESAADAPLWAKPNAGLPRLEGSKTVFDVSPEQMAGFALQAAQLGARVIGGCCGTTPEHLNSMAQAIKGFNREAAPHQARSTKRGRS